MKLMVLAFFSWWYGPGWKQVAASLRPRLSSVAVSFSVSLIVPTLFEPWRRIVSEPGRALEDRLRAKVDNLFSRAVGFVVRVLVLLAAGVCLVLVGVLTVIELILWPLLPLAVPGCLVAGIAL